MAWDDPYADVAAYRDGVTKSSTSSDETILRQLKAISRFIEVRLGSEQRPRVFNQSDASTVRYFDGNGGIHIYVDDLVTLTSLEVDVDASGSWETAVPTASLFLKPYHASEFGKPYTSIELASWQTTIRRFPDRAKAIKAMGTWGWPSVPGGIVDATIGITRQLRDLHEAGFPMTIEAIDTAIRQAPQASYLLQDIMREYSRRPLFA